MEIKIRKIKRVLQMQEDNLKSTESLMDKRRHIRIDSFNLSHVCLEEDGMVINECVGKTLNVSESGILLETRFFIPNNCL